MKTVCPIIIGLDSFPSEKGTFVVAEKTGSNFDLLNNNRRKKRPIIIIVLRIENILFRGSVINI